MKTSGWLLAALIGSSAACQMIAGIDDRSVATLDAAAGGAAGSGGSNDINVEHSDAASVRRDSGAPKDAAKDGPNDGALAETGLDAQPDGEEVATDAAEADADAQAANSDAGAEPDAVATEDAEVAPDAGAEDVQTAPIDAGEDVSAPVDAGDGDATAE